MSCAKPMRWAYADPPYLGQALKHYSHDPNAREVNHRLLLGYLDAHFDCWALSASSPSLFGLAAMVQELGLTGVRILSWVKPFASFKPGVGVAFAWEPVLVKGGRRRTRQQPTVRDWVAANITLKRGLSGAKPATFCHWLFDVVNAQDGDVFEDVFPGSGAVGEAWRDWCARKRGELRQGDMPLLLGGGQ